jgi:hypothetical protein
MLTMPAIVILSGAVSSEESVILWQIGFFGAKSGVRRRFVHRLKPVSDIRNPLKRVGRASSGLQRTLAIRRRFESAGLAETMTDAQKAALQNDNTTYRRHTYFFGTALATPLSY